MDSLLDLHRPFHEICERLNHLNKKQKVDKSYDKPLFELPDYDIYEIRNQTHRIRQILINKNYKDDIMTNLRKIIN